MLLFFSGKKESKNNRRSSDQLWKLENRETNRGRAVYTYLPGISTCLPVNKWIEKIVQERTDKHNNNNNNIKRRRRKLFIDRPTTVRTNSSTILGPRTTTLGKKRRREVCWSVWRCEFRRISLWRPCCSAWSRSSLWPFRSPGQHRPPTTTTTTTTTKVRSKYYVRNKLRRAIPR